MRLIWIVMLLIGLFAQDAAARTARYRAMWREDPATTMVIGWDQLSGATPTVVYDLVDHGDNAAAYRFRHAPDRSVQAKGMRNHFARLTGLQPNTVYYFLITDTEGQSRRMTFQTMPNDPNVRLSIIAGGDSRNFREACQDANRLVSKLRPHFVMFNGDMTAEDINTEWIAWMDDWQLTIGSDGRLFPVMVARGNHEQSNQVLIDLFDVPSANIYYALTFGGNLLRMYTLNSMIPVGGEQQAWLDRDLRGNGQTVWKIAQYHLPSRPHTTQKIDKEEQVLYWSTLFYKYRVQLAIESDAHVVKTTWPIRPSRESGSDEGFIRDDEGGTVYLGEGCWGAPLRPNDDDKRWTRASGSFNSFHWIFVDQYRIETRVVKTDGSSRVGEVSPADPFKAPYGLVVWNPSNGDVITLVNTNASPGPLAGGVKQRLEVQDFGADVSGADMAIVWSSDNEGQSAAFEVQRSVDGGARYTTIAIIPGKGPGRNRYSFIDPGVARQGPPNRVRYRLNCRQPDYDDKLYELRPPGPPPVAGGGKPTAPPPAAGSPALVQADARGQVAIQYTITLPASIDLILIGEDMRELARLNYPNQVPGSYTKSLDLSKAPAGQYSLLVKANGQLLHRYTVRR